MRPLAYAHRSWGERQLHDLFLLNIALQLFDGVATYQGLQVGWREANPILVASFAHLGVGTSLLLFKAKACALIVLLHRYRNNPVVIAALVFVAGIHLVLSLIPWSAKFASLALASAAAR